MLDFITPYYEVIGILSILFFLLSISLIPWAIGRLPYDFFIESLPSKPAFSLRHQIKNVPLIIFRNLLGLLFLAAGIIMLFTPGQGLLSIILGFSIMVFPGKKKLLSSLVKYSSIRTSLNWIRKKTNTEPFIWD
jgi:hypothetical protein